MSIRQHLIDNEAQLTAAWGESLPPVTDGLMSAATRLAAQPPDPDSRGRLAWGGGGAFRVPEQLAAAYRHTGDEKFAESAAAWFRHWLAIEDFADYAGPGGTLDICHRLGDTEVPGWFGALPHLCTGPAFSDDLLAEIVAAATVQLNYLASHVYSGRNMRMSQLDCLLTSALRLDFVDDAATWRDVGLRGLNDMFFRHFHADGSSIESTGWYHYICQNMALRFYRLRQARPELGLQISRDTVVKALDYTLACIEPDGKFNRIGDCTPGVHPFKTLAEFLAHRAGILRQLDCPEKLPPTSQYFPDTGQALLRDNWTADATYITFDATACNAFHWHPGRNALQLCVHGRKILADPGRMRYERTPQRLHAVTTRAHNTLTLNGWNQAKCAASFRSRSAPGYEIVDSLYAGGYWPCDGLGYGLGVCAEHHRTVLWIRDRLLVVLDHLADTSAQEGNPDIESNWQFTPGPLTVQPGEGVVEAVRGEAAIAMLFPLRPAEMTLSQHEGETEPVAGWVADDDDDPTPSPLIRWTVRAFDPWNLDLATVIVLGRRNELALPRVTAVRDPEVAGHGHLALTWPDASVDRIWWTRRLAQPLEEVDEICTDAALAHVRTTAGGALAQALVYDGSWLAPWQPVWRATRKTFAFDSVL